MPFSYVRVRCVRFWVGRKQNKNHWPFGILAILHGARFIFIKTIFIIVIFLAAISSIYTRTSFVCRYSLLSPMFFFHLVSMLTTAICIFLNEKFRRFTLYSRWLGHCENTHLCVEPQMRNHIPNTTSAHSSLKTKIFFSIYLPGWLEQRAVKAKKDEVKTSKIFRKIFISIFHTTQNSRWTRKTFFNATQTNAQIIIANCFKKLCKRNFSYLPKVDKQLAEVFTWNISIVDRFI